MVCRSSHRCCELRHRCGRCVAAATSSAHPKNEQSHPSRNVLVDHPKQLTFSWTTEKKRSRQDCQRHYQIMIGYVHMRVFFPINREESHLALFSYDITVDPLSRHIHLNRVDNSFFFCCIIVASSLLPPGK